MLLGAPGLTTRNKNTTSNKGIAIGSKDATTFRCSSRLLWKSSDKALQFGGWRCSADHLAGGGCLQNYTATLCFGIQGLPGSMPAIYNKE